MFIKYLEFLTVSKDVSIFGCPILKPNDSREREPPYRREWSGRFEEHLEFYLSY